ncbi:hypothetical protein TUBRATIS_12700 [Tubulinosema ratisbonensis]|uniref:Uncharacterized protein n=1 Tax=Tubulinosema ratisbonensis TaxID=291195 RepID=A0A437AMN2_9MICR|nr:hypothetical protein TUBRATIS_12700 [Tubulinosema ratisbonensis]
MNLKRIPLYITICGTVLITILEIIKPTFFKIRQSHAVITGTEADNNTFDLNIAVYILVIPLVMNTVIICMLGKYSHESTRSMIKCYISTIHLTLMSFIINIIISDILNILVINSYFLTNCVQISSTILLVIFNSIGILNVEISELKRIYNTKNVIFSLICANKRGFYLLLAYFTAYSISLVYFFNRIMIYFVGIKMFYIFCLSFSLSFVNSFVMMLWYKKRSKM